MRETSVAIIGCGYVTNGHLEAWRKVRQARVVAVCDLNEALAKNTANQCGVPRYYDTLTELVGHEKVDLVDVATPPQTHAALAVEAMEAGISVLLEKPMTMTVKDAEQIVDCQKRTCVKAGVIHNWLFEPPVLEAKSLAKRGLLGEVLNVEVEAISTKDDSMCANERHWCHRLPGGRFSEMLSHPVYIIRHFLGDKVEVSDVQVAKLGGYAWMKSDELCATFRVDSKLGRTYASFNAPRDAIFVSLYGREATLKLDIVNATTTVLPRRKTNRLGKGFDSLKQANQLIGATVRNVGAIASGRWLSGHDMCIRLFGESLISDAEPPVTVEDGLTVVRALEEMCKKIEAAERKV